MGGCCLNMVGVVVGGTNIVTTLQISEEDPKHLLSDILSPWSQNT